MEGSMRITLLGVRGSIPASDAANFGKYGCATMCVSVQTPGATVFLDAGSGLMNAKEPDIPLSPRCALLLSHPHADHLLGLPGWPRLFAEDFQISIWAQTRGGLEPMQQAAALMSPPLWPVGPEGFRADIAWRPLPRGSVHFGKLQIEHTESKHPGGVTAFRLSVGERRMVYATDCELDEAAREKLLPFARGCELLLCDAQYTDEEYLDRSGWGHSSVSMALAFSAQCGAKRTVLIHHAPLRTDAELDALAEKVYRARPDCSIGKQGEQFSI